MKVWQPWQRDQALDASASPWLRVSHPWAGNQQGAAFLPRVGQEVTVEYYGGDPDLPVVAGSMHNALNMPGWALPGQHVLSGRVNIDPGQPEFHVVPDRSRPLDFEVYSVVSMQTQPEVGQSAQQFRPLYDTLNHDEGDHGRYFSLRREARLQSQSSRRYGARSEYVGTEVFASLVDQREAPYSANLRHLSVQAWLTNRDLPTLMPCNGVDDLMLGGPESGIKAGFLWRPTSPRAPFAAGESAWRLIRQLGFNHLPLTELDHREGGQALRDMLRLFAPDGIPAVQAEIGALIGSRLAPVTRRLPGSGPLVYGRGVQCTLTVDEKGFSGSSPYLFGLILSYYLTRHVAINTFVETKLVSIQRGDVGLWSVRPGTRGVA